jgi:thymidylate kinase
MNDPPIFGVNRRWVVLDGIDGVGKTTLSVMLVKALKRRGFKCVFDSEWSESSLGVFIRKRIETDRFFCIDPRRKCAEAETALLFADWLYRLHWQVLPSLKRGHYVVSDRGARSLYAYQSERLSVTTELSAAIEDLLNAVWKTLRLLRQNAIEIVLTSDSTAVNDRLMRRREEPLPATALEFLMRVQGRMLELEPVTYTVQTNARNLGAIFDEIQSICHQDRDNDANINC